MKRGSRISTDEELRRLYWERAGLQQIDPRTCLDPAWLRKRSEAVTELIEKRLAKLTRRP